MNRKGYLVFTYWTFAMFGMMAIAIASIATNGPHIAKRAVERCVEVDGGSQEECAAIISSWTKEERVEYIRDKLEANCTVNFENGTCG